jgi:hypothetical protein
MELTDLLTNKWMESCEAEEFICSAPNELLCNPIECHGHKYLIFGGD